MEVLERLEDFVPNRQPLVLTIGNFDGMHRGHCAVLKRARSFAGNEGEIVVLTFRNHPSEILRPEQPTPLLCTLPHKLQLLQQIGVDTVLLLPFTGYLAKHSAASFIERIRQFIPFSYLVLGHDATLGRDRQGKRPIMLELGDQWGFNVFYQEEYRFEGQPVSSTRIREALRQGDFDQVNQLLDRPYSIYALVSKGKGKGKQMGIPTANLEVAGLCLPPYGVYAVEVIKNSRSIQGVANLGIAPTMRMDVNPILEVHLFDYEQNLYGDYLEVIFKNFIRPEQKFNNLEELHEQITIDIKLAKEFFSSHPSA
jgi:riboflavin kinase / FMN adenylyltransferase